MDGTNGSPIESVEAMAGRFYAEIEMLTLVPVWKRQLSAQPSDQLLQLEHEVQAAFSR